MPVSISARANRFVGLCAIALLTGAVAFSHATPAAAQGAATSPKLGSGADEKAKKDEAKTAFKEAKKKFDADDFAGALPLYEKADTLYPGSAPKHKIALCYDKLGKTAEAVAAYKAFLGSNPSDKYADRVTAANARVAELEATMPSTVIIKVAPEGVAAQITVNGTPATGPELTLPAGEHTIVVTAEGHTPLTEVVTLRGNEKRELSLTLTPAAAPLPPEPPPVEPQPAVEEEGRSNVPAYVTLGIAGAGVILGTVFGIQALGAKSDFDDEPSVDNADEAERAALIADMSFGVALTFGITGAVLLFSGGDDEPGEASAKPVLLPFGGPKGGGMAATWTF
jgi:hypothetical protein